MNELIRVAADLQEFCAARRWRSPEILTELARRRAELER